MPQTAWGKATLNQGGGGDANVMKLGEQNRIRLLDAEGPRKWRQHSIDGEVLHEIFPEVDASTFRSVTCPRGPDGNAAATCPLDMKPSYIDDDGKVQQLFPVSIRYAANVWDYESGSVKVLIGGKQIFSDFDAAAAMGFDPTASDFMIFKLGKDRQTSYKVVRGNSDPLPKELKPEDLHDLDKYETPMPADKVFELLGELGVDYDAIPLPEFTLDEALQFVMPYTKKAKGLTMEQLAATDLDFMKWLYGEKRSQGQYGDAVFQAMHTVLLDLGETTPLDEIPKAPPRAAVSKPPAAPVAGPDAESLFPQVTLIAPDGSEGLYPEAAKASLLAAGFTEPAPPKDEPTEEGIVTLVGPDGAEVEVQRGSMDALLGVGFTVKATGEAAPPTPPVTYVLVGPDGTEVPTLGMPAAAIAAMRAAGYVDPPAAEPAAPAEPADDAEVVIDIGGTLAQMPYGQAKAIISTGAATLVTGRGPASATPPAPPFSVADDEKVPIKLKSLPATIELPFAQAKSLFLLSQGDFEGPTADDLRAFARADDANDDKAVAQHVAQNSVLADPTEAQAAAGDPYDKNLTAGPNAAGEFTHPAIPDRGYKTKGAVTQALNKLKERGVTPSASLAGSHPVAQGAPATGYDAKMEQAKALVSQNPGYVSDFEALMKLFQEVSDNKRNISDFDEADLDRLIERLRAEATAG